MSNDDIFNGYGIEVNLNKDFNIILETISRIGFAGKLSKKLYQSCHIFHKKGRYAIMHFKEMFAFDGKPSNITEDDIARRNRIALLLEQWGLVTIIHPEDITEVADISNIKVVKSAEKKDWTFEQKYSLGARKV